MHWCAPKMRTSWWWTPTAATASHSPPGATWCCATSRASWWATSCYASRFRHEDLPPLLDRVSRRRAILPERRADLALVGADAESRGPGAGRPLPHHEKAGRGRHGPGVPRRTREDGTPQCHQGDEPLHGARPGGGGRGGGWGWPAGDYDRIGGRHIRVHEPRAALGRPAGWTERRLFAGTCAL